MRQWDSWGQSGNKKEMGHENQNALDAITKLSKINLIINKNILLYAKLIYKLAQ